MSLIGLDAILNLPAIQTASQTAARLNMPCYLVGGVLRDALLHRPIKDIDLLVVGNGPDFAGEWAKDLKGQPKVHMFRNFGTAMLETEQMQFEVVGARRESYHSGSRKPVVTDGTLEDDLSRRDFTVNALAYELY
ncbi:MAG: tRNA nucleotidyltransferase, partial [Bacteroidota bacterium]